MAGRGTPRRRKENRLVPKKCYYECYTMWAVVVYQVYEHLAQAGKSMHQGVACAVSYDQWYS